MIVLEGCGSFLAAESPCAFTEQIYPPCQSINITILGTCVKGTGQHTREYKEQSFPSRVAAYQQVHIIINIILYYLPLKLLNYM